MTKKTLSVEFLMLSWEVAKRLLIELYKELTKKNEFVLSKRISTPETTLNTHHSTLKTALRAN